MADFDAIVVGAGCAGSVAAYELASAGKSVLMVERGNYAGAKNMTGGRIYSHSLKKVFPNFEQEAPGATRCNGAGFLDVARCESDDWFQVRRDAEGGAGFLYRSARPI